jgi:glucosamine 6-phosphate synthetase-like amidotransferase/phosphosugar isomerase protein
MCGIFAYVNYLVEKDRKFVIDTLLGGLARLEYRGYDSAGMVTAYFHCHLFTFDSIIKCRFSY